MIIAEWCNLVASKPHELEVLFKSSSSDVFVENNAQGDKEWQFTQFQEEW